MRGVATLHIRNVPEDVYAWLRERARRSGRSLNAEVVEALRATVDRGERAGFMERLEELRREFLLPDDAPPAEVVVREARDERAREIDRRARGL
jgi:plasmid stability protein